MVRTKKAKKEMDTITKQMMMKTATLKMEISMAIILIFLSIQYILPLPLMTMLWKVVGMIVIICITNLMIQFQEKLNRNASTKSSMTHTTWYKSWL